MVWIDTALANCFATLKGNHKQRRILKWNSVICAVPFLLCGLVSYAQNYPRHQPMESYDASSIGLMQRVIAEGKKYTDPLPRNHGLIKAILEEHVDNHLTKIKAGTFIKNKELEVYLNDLVAKLVKTIHAEAPFIILVERSTQVNAFCTPIGSFLIFNGLLARLDCEEQLAFVLAHEIAHWELEHIKKRIEFDLNSDAQNEALKEWNKIRSGKLSMESVKIIRDWNYSTNRYSRETELQADSLAFEMYSRLYSNMSAPLEVFHLLDSGNTYSPEYGARIFTHLDFDEYPFKKAWAVDVSDRNYYSAIKKSDSLRSHPVTDKRIAEMKLLTGDQEVFNYKGTCERYREIKFSAQLENIASSYVNDLLQDDALYHALRLKMQHPYHPYVNEMIGKILLKTAKLKSEGRFIIRDNLTSYNKEQQYINNFLVNIKSHEAAEIAFHFLNQKGNFDPTYESHFKLLYDVCKQSKRAKLSLLVKERYRVIYPQGTFLNEMD